MSTKNLICIAAAALAASIANVTSADVHQFMTCKLNPGKTSADAYALYDRAMAWNKAQKLPQPKTFEILWPFFGSERDPGTLVLHYVAGDFGEYGAALKGIWDDGLSASNPIFTANDVWTCSQAQVFWTPAAPEAE